MLKTKNKIVLLLMAGLTLASVTPTTFANADTASARDQTIPVKPIGKRHRKIDQLDNSQSIRKESKISHNDTIKVFKRHSYHNHHSSNLIPINVNLNHNHKHSHDGNIDTNDADEIEKDIEYHHKMNQFYDHSHANIGHMSEFIHKRAPYRYTTVGGNTRDLGGYPTWNNKYRTRDDRIIRSADLNGISKQGLKELERLGVNKDVDLRYVSGKNGIQGHPDPGERNSNYLNGTDIEIQRDPMYTHQQAKNLYSKIDHSSLARKHTEYYFYGHLSVDTPQAIKSYRKIFKDLLHNKHGAILFHCNLGRDRTGTTSALILATLGISHNTIYHDYLLTDHYRYKYNGLKRQPYSKQAGELKHFFIYIDDNYGTVNNYLNREVGLSNKDIHKLRAMYLEPNYRTHHNKSYYYNSHSKKNGKKSHSHFHTNHHDNHLKFHIHMHKNGLHQHHSHASHHSHYSHHNHKSHKKNSHK